MSPEGRVDRRQLVALAVVVIASIASVASMDQGPPVVPYTGDLADQSVALTETSPGVSVTVHVDSTQYTGTAELTIHLTASWPSSDDLDFEDAGAGDAGAGDAGAGDAGAPDLPIVAATLGDGDDPDAAVTLDRAITMSPGTGELIITNQASCTASPTGCGGSFTFTLRRIELLPSGTINVRWTATATVLSDSGAAVVTVSVTP